MRRHYVADDFRVVNAAGLLADPLHGDIRLITGCAVAQLLHPDAPVVVTVALEILFTAFGGLALSEGLGGEGSRVK
jgi:hypothetical protein